MKNKIGVIILGSLFVFYVTFLLANSQGYYKSRSEKAKELTDEQIVEFERDVAAGKSIDIRKYVLYEEKDYSNNVSNDVYKISLKLESVFDSVIKIIFNSASKAVNS